MSKMSDEKKIARANFTIQTNCPMQYYVVQVFQSPFHSESTERKSVLLTNEEAQTFLRRKLIQAVSG